MKLQLGLNQKLSQQLRLAPQIIQSIEILQLPALDLRELIEHELQENEALEVIEPAPDEFVDRASADREMRQKADEDQSSDFEVREFSEASGIADVIDSKDTPVADMDHAAASTDSRTTDEAVKEDVLSDAQTSTLLERIDGLRESATVGDRGTRAAQEASDRKLEAIHNTPAHDPSLADHLLNQLDELELSAELSAATEAVVYNLNDRGLLDCSDEEILAGMDEPVSMEVLEKAIRVVQRLEPRGVGARNVGECILLQIPSTDPDAVQLGTLIREHFDDLLRNKRPKIAKAMGLKVSELNTLTERLRDFDFRPGAAFSSAPTRYIRPDVIIEQLTDADLDAIRSGERRDTTYRRPLHSTDDGYTKDDDSNDDGRDDRVVNDRLGGDESARHESARGYAYDSHSYDSNTFRGTTFQGNGGVHESYGNGSAHVTPPRSSDPYRADVRNHGNLHGGAPRLGIDAPDPSNARGDASAHGSKRPSRNPDLGRYSVRLVHEHLPRVGLSPAVRAMLKEQKHDPSVRDYLKQKIEAARWLIDAIAQRQSTLERVAREIVARQRDYLDFGVSHLRPLKMQEIADVLGIHVSTVSRAISDKYAQTPRGIVPLKFFFTGGTENEDGGIESRMSVKERVREIIDDEDKQKPLSDDDVAEQLKVRFGLEIARRTVTKYRKALNIPSSRQRRVWE